MIELYLVKIEKEISYLKGLESLPPFDKDIVITMFE